MKLLAILWLAIFLNGNDPRWLTDFALAKLESKQSGKYILLNFSGSDWCTPCIRMHKTFFESPAFEAFAEKKLVLLNADFPRLKKHQLTKQMQKQNDDLAEHYNAAGKFPFTLLMNSEGRIIRSWDGCPDKSPETLVAEINKSIDDDK